MAAMLTHKMNEGQWRNPDLGHTCLQEQLTELLGIPAKNSVRNKEKKNRTTISKRFPLYANAIITFFALVLALLNEQAAHALQLLFFGI